MGVTHIVEQLENDTRPRTVTPEQTGDITETLDPE